jgi:hypothetical protein
MSYYVIGVGGSGARAVEALIHLCAAGLAPKKVENIKFVMVDPDTANSSWTRTAEIAKIYADLREVPKGPCDFQRLLIERLGGVWSPFGDAKADAQKLEQLFNYPALPSESRCLFDQLYTPEQRGAKLDIGFRGRPSIGAAIFGATLDMAKVEPWTGLVADIATATAGGERVWVFILGSLFGGTGASGLPTIARMLASAPSVTRANMAIGGAFLLPYFQFTVPPNPGHAVYADSLAFPRQTRQALEFYGLMPTDYNRIYAVGVDQPMSQRTFSVGGADQINRAHVVELLSALAAMDFFANGVPGVPTGAQCAVIAREKPREFTWTDVPNVQWQDAGTRSHSVPSREKLGQLARTAFAYLKLFYPHLKQALHDANSTAQTPWYVDLVKNHGVDLKEKPVEDTLVAAAKLSAANLRWLQELHTDTSTLDVRLVEVQAFGDLTHVLDDPSVLDESRFPKLVEGWKDRSLTDVWRLMCARRDRGPVPRVSGLGYFLKALYELCG